MTKIATRGAKLTGVLAWEMEPEVGYSRSTATVTVEAGMDVGSVVVLAAGKYKWVAAADVATLAADVRVVIDPRVTETAAGDASLTLLGNELAVAPAMVVRGGLKFKDALTSGQIDTVITKLNAKGIRAVARV